MSVGPGTFSSDHNPGPCEDAVVAAIVVVVGDAGVVHSCRAAFGVAIVAAAYSLVAQKMNDVVVVVVGVVLVVLRRRNYCHCY